MVFVCQLAGERVAISQYVTLNYEPFNMYFTAVKQNHGILMKLGDNHLTMVK